MVYLLDFSRNVLHFAADSSVHFPVHSSAETFAVPAVTIKPLFAPLIYFALYGSQPAMIILSDYVESFVPRVLDARLVKVVSYN